MQPALLGVEPLAKVDVAGLVRWISDIDFSDWPQQRPLGDGQLRPAMMSDPAWHGFKAKTDGLVGRLMENFSGHSEDTRMLSVVMPGHSIEPHVDLQSPNWLCRVHVPLLTNDASLFIVEGVPHRMEVGTAYMVDTRVEHSVTNYSDTPRVHLFFDVRGRA